MRAFVVSVRATATWMPATTPRADDSNIARLIRNRYMADLAHRAAEVADLSRRVEAAQTEIHRLKRQLRRAQRHPGQLHTIDD